MVTNRRTVDVDGQDFYPTPAWATYALLGNENFVGDIWDPACGDGAMADILVESQRDRFPRARVIASDLYDRGYGLTGVDFLSVSILTDNIITNPPYHLAEAFVRQALRLSRIKVAFLMRLAFLEGAKRANGIFRTNPPARIWVFSERITFYPRGVQEGGGGTTAYAWFVWDHTKSNVTTELRWIQPGLRARYNPKKENPT